jgi:hypothetical protein
VQTALQLRYLQTLREIGASQNSTVVFPMPIDLVKPVIEATGGMFAAGQSDSKQQKQLPDGASTELTPGSVEDASADELSQRTEDGVPEPAEDRQRPDQGEASAAPRRSAKP